MRPCRSCSARLARDNAGSVCSPCRRAEIERLARRAALVTHDPDGVRQVFDADGLRGVTAFLACSADDALDVLLALGLLPAAYRRRLDTIRRLVEMDGLSHIAAGDALGISRWTVATYRRDLGLDRAPGRYSRPARRAVATA